MKSLIRALAWFAERPWYVRLLLVLPWLVVGILLLAALLLRLVPARREPSPPWGVKKDSVHPPANASAVKLLEQEIKESAERAKQVDESTDAALRPTRRLKETIATADHETLSDILNKE